MRSLSRFDGWLRGIAFSTLLALGAPSVLRAQGSAPPAVASIPAAMSHLYAGDAAGAARMLESITTAEPRNVSAWRLLALCYRKSGDLDRARTAYGRAMALEPGSPTTMFNLAGVFALEGQTDSAFALLARVRSSHNYDMTQLEVDSAYTSLRSDARYKPLLPTAADFANPFVEKVKVLLEIDGDSAGDQFGWIARDMGDVDHDGANDFVTSAPTKNVDGENAGRVSVYSSRTGKLLWSANGKPGEQLGTGVESAGDVDGDGVQDVVAGAPYSGRAYVYSGTDGHALFTLRAENDSDAFGQHVSSAGDVDHDGHADFLIGAPQNRAGGRGAGRAYLYSGKDGHLLLTLTGERAGDAFGSTVGGYSDSLHTFLVVGAPAAGSGKTGRTYVYDGLSKKPKFIIESDSTGRALGAMFVSVMGDVNGDGVPDVFASDFTNGAKGPSTGRIYVHSGRDGKRLITLTGEGPGEGFGIGPGKTGDVDHDGRADLVVGSWQYSNAATSGGRVYLYSGHDGHLIETYTDRIPGDTFGFDAVGIGDVDGDGTVDFLLTAAWSGVHGNHSGRIFIVSSRVK
ncbi:MAG TPA: FG-GAP-like repeat-containing protein [Gemmatimonadaceae bacterium]|nr:FG-GAP-like repeat-containing protein [Gemmatimonadaceae bacterium]